jgi:hypothetical protein
MSKVPHKTKHFSDPWMKMREVYSRLPQLSRQTVLRLVKTGKIPGGELIYRLDRRSGEKEGAGVWNVRRVKFDAWERLRNLDAVIESASEEDKKSDVG